MSQREFLMGILILISGGIGGGRGQTEKRTSLGEIRKMYFCSQLKKHLIIISICLLYFL